jgi:aminoglycoside phosphotransferase family enzyme
VRGREAECHRYHAQAARPPEQVAAATAQALHSPRSFPGSEAHIECIETHMSWVFLTRALAYKLKKPSRTAYFDYTSLGARRRACELELQLNRRLAASVYRAVVPVTSRAGELEVEGSGEIVEWLVKMRRLPSDRMLDARIASNAVTPAEVDAVASVLSRFYTAAPKAGLDGAQYAEHLATDLEAKCASLLQPRYDLEPGAVRAAFEALTGWLRVHSAWVEARGPLVCEAHGDLRPEHVCLEVEPVIVDCLDFDRGLRLLDPWSELAFLELECRRLGNAWMGPRLAWRYVQETKDSAPEPLRGFYQGYHAFVRAAVAAWHLDEPGQNLDQWRGRAAEYLRLAKQP